MILVIGTFQAEGVKDPDWLRRDSWQVPRALCGKAHLRPVTFATTATIPVWIRVRRGSGIVVLLPRKGVTATGGQF